MGMHIRLILVVLSAGLGIAVFPPVGWAWLAVVAWVPLLLALQGVKASHGLYLGLLHGAIFYGATMSWLVNVFQGSETFVIPLVLILALFTGFFARGYALASIHYKKVKKEWLVAWFAAVWWVAVEYFRCEIFTLKFPWMSPGVGLGPMWISPVLGVYGISFVLILGSAMLCHAGKNRVIGGVILALMLVSVLMPRATPSVDDPIKVMALQSELMDGETYAEMTEAVSEEVDLIVWPEYGIPIDIRAHQREWLDLILLAKRKEAVMVVGTQTVMDDDQWHNTALTFNGDGELGTHYKNHTVHFFDDGTAGTEQKAINTELGKVGTPICFDCDYEDVVRGMVVDGAEFLAVPSMDAEHWSVREHWQHAELFRHRAAENGRWMVVSSTSGLTQMIDPYGNRTAELPLVIDGTLLGEIGRLSELTFYTRVGWMFPWLMMGVGGCWVLGLFFQFVFLHRSCQSPK